MNPKCVWGSVVACLVLLVATAWPCLAAPLLRVGVGKIDVTPDFPVLLSGYAARKAPTDGVAQPLYARALAIGTSREDACVLVALDNTAIPASLTEAVGDALRIKAGLGRERFVLSCTHTHCAPCLHGALTHLFGRPVTAGEQQAIDRYTALVAAGIEKAAMAALADLSLATLELGYGSANFAINRRTKGGPVDRAMPLLVARDPATGKPRAVLVNYACHCTTLGPDTNYTSGDWAGLAAEAIEREQGGGSFVALISIGCGADSNPDPRGTMDMARRHGDEIAKEVARLLGTTLRAVTAPPAGKIERFGLAFDTLPTRDEWKKLAARPDAIGHNARGQLARLERGEAIGADLPYVAQSWVFGDQLAMVFLAGEVVVDYSLRLKREFDPTRLWVSAYCNDVPCYIPSRRILAEGGYEGAGAMVYYGLPGRLAPAVENDIDRAVHALLPKSFRSAASLEEFPPPKSPDDSLEAFRLDDPSLRIESVVTEPLVASPVAIDWDIHGRLWVVEMLDYPAGLHENWTPGGRIKMLESTKHDGHYDKATIVLDHLRFPQGVMCWRDGVLVCAAPEILFAPFKEGRTSPAKTLFSGFSPDNQQWAVNGLAWGLDGWVYGASSIRNDSILIGDTDRTVPLGGRDFRMNPDTLAFEPAAGRTQFCRVRDDFDHWFGNDNSNPLWNFPFPERYIARNPHVSPPASRVAVVVDADPTRIYPISRLLERFNSPQSANRVTSGCGPGIYRDQLLGAAFHGNAFFCEPVHNLVRRLTLEPSGATFQARRAPADRDAEFLSSTDNWFRPVQVRTGPDGALWVVDMYRFLIEHPRWISADRLSRLDTRAGWNMGRIYRILPKGSSPRPLEDLGALASDQLAARLDSPNGTLRDLVHRELIHRQDPSAVPVLRATAQRSAVAAARLQGLYALDGLHSLAAADLLPALADEDAGVRAGAVRLAESRLAAAPDLALALAKLEADPRTAVRFQVALTLGEWDDARAVGPLARIARRDLQDPWIRAAVANASIHRPVELLDALAASLPEGAGRGELLGQVALVCAATADRAGVSKAVLTVLGTEGESFEPWQFMTAAALLDAQGRRSQKFEPAAEARLAAATSAARVRAADVKAPTGQRVAALRLLGRDPVDPADVKLLAMLIRPQAAPALRAAALDAASRSADLAIARILIDAWPAAAPALRGPLLQVLVSRPAAALALLDAVGRDEIAAAEIPLETRARLLQSDAPPVKARAAVVLATPQSSRASVIRQYDSALKLAGDASRGEALFVSTCAACHLVKGVGHAVGPDLLALTDRSSQYLVTSILDPNAAVEGKYMAYRVQTTDGRDLVGIIVDETAAAVTILAGNGIRESVKRSEIKSMASTRLSLMPEGLEQAMKPAQLADLIRFLQKN